MIIQSIDRSVSLAVLHKNHWNIRASPASYESRPTHHTYSYAILACGHFFSFPYCSFLVSGNCKAGRGKLHSKEEFAVYVYVSPISLTICWYTLK